MPQANASVQPIPFFSSNGGETHTDARTPAIKPRKYQLMVPYSEKR